jgi:hypothetical protein
MRLRALAPHPSSYRSPGIALLSRAHRLADVGRLTDRELVSLCRQQVAVWRTFKRVSLSDDIRSCCATRAALKVSGKSQGIVRAV